MRFRLAVVATVLALGVSAFTATPTAAGPPSGNLKCDVGHKVTNVIFGPDFSIQTVGEAVRKCRNDSGRPLRIDFCLHLASDEGVITILYLYFWRESAINLGWLMNAHIPQTILVTS